MRTLLFKQPIKFSVGAVVYLIDIIGNITITLPDGKTRNIGILVQNEKTVEYHILRNPEKHLFRKSNSYGVNSEIINRIRPEIITFHIVGEPIHIIDIDTLLKYGTYLHFKKQDFELQIFIEVSRLKTYRFTAEVI